MYESEQAINLVRKAMLMDESLETPGCCRDAVKKLYQQLHEHFPDLLKRYLVYRDPETGESLHYSLLITNHADQNYIINPVQAALFPQYLGPEETAPFTFQKIKTTEEIT